MKRYPLLSQLGILSLTRTTSSIALVKAAEINIGTSEGYINLIVDNGTTDPK